MCCTYFANSPRLDIRRWGNRQPDRRAARQGDQESFLRRRGAMEVVKSEIDSPGGRESSTSRRLSVGIGLFTSIKPSI